MNILRPPVMLRGYGRKGGLGGIEPDCADFYAGKRPKSRFCEGGWPRAGGVFEEGFLGGFGGFVGGRVWFREEDDDGEDGWD